MKEQQLKWIEEEYPNLEKVAQAIIQDSVTAAEDVTSNAVERILKAIQAGTCYASNKAQFIAYCRIAVRNAASDYFTKYTGDVREDKAKSNLMRKMRPSTRRTPAYNIDTADLVEYSPHERFEDISEGE